MDGSGWVDDALAERDRGGRFAPGVSGNPAGKRKGTRNRATIMAEMLAAAASGVPAKNSAAETPPAPTLVRALARAGVDLHSACNCRRERASRRVQRNGLGLHPACNAMPSSGLKRFPRRRMLSP
jgi:hypothetical protein